jgi:AraC-like DNA-binding protein
MRYLRRTARLIPRGGAPLRQLLRGDCYAVEETIGAGFTDRGRRIAYFAVIFTAAGSSCYTIRQEQVVIEPGSLLLLGRGISFSERAPEDCHNLYLMLDGPVTVALQAGLQAAGGWLYWPDCPRPVESALRSCVASAHGPSGFAEWRFASALCLLVEALLERMRRARARSDLAEQVRGIVREDLEASWDVARLARAAGISESALAHRFPGETGLTPARFVRELRCEAAAAMLATGLTVAETSARCGFANPYHFSRCFKQVTGAPPSSVRPMAPRLLRSR